MKITPPTDIHSVKCLHIHTCTCLNDEHLKSTCRQKQSQNVVLKEQHDLKIRQLMYQTKGRVNAKFFHDATIHYLVLIVLIKSMF